MSDDAEILGLSTLANYELFLRIVQRTQRLARILLDTPELVTREHLEQWEADMIALQPDIEFNIRKWQEAMTRRIAAAPAGSVS